MNHEREIVVNGRTWTVAELTHPTTRTLALVFTCPTVARRVYVYPPNWRELTDQALYALSWSK